MEDTTFFLYCKLINEELFEKINKNYIKTDGYIIVDKYDSEPQK
jgi:hypothetical protein